MASESRYCSQAVDLTSFIIFIFICYISSFNLCLLTEWYLSPSTYAACQAWAGLQSQMQRRPSVDVGGYVGK